VVSSSEHELFHRPTELLDGTIPASRSELTHSSVDVRLSPEETGTVVEEIEVVGIIALLLDYLELNVLVIQSFVVDGAARLAADRSCLRFSARGFLSHTALAEKSNWDTLILQHILDMLYSGGPFRCAIGVRSTAPARDGVPE
jgi:hypothetical protein